MTDARCTLLNRGLMICGLLLALGCGRHDAVQNPHRIEESQAPPQSVPTVAASPVKSDPVEELEQPKTTSLMQAASEGNLNDVKFHLRRDPEALHRSNDFGMTPLHLAADKGQDRVVEILLQAGADVNVPNANVQATPLQYAATGGFVQAVRVLLDANANVNATDSVGRTPLMWAASKGQESVVKLLLERGADANQTTPAGWTALKYAEQGMHSQVAALLRQHAPPDRTATR
ncbi:MAG: ankyrin repeat domain-containing protein [Planctomycetes bacterium]|nr:ankyrin repeat domain-containing protein [Planctomycetota bacterium]